MKFFSSKVALLLSIILFPVVTSVYSQNNETEKLLDSLIDLVITQPEFVLRKIDSIEKSTDIALFNDGNIYMIKGQANYSLSNFSKTYKNYLKGVEFSKKKKTPLAEGDFYLLLAELFTDIKDFKKSNQYISLSLEKFNLANDVVGILDANFKKAINFSALKEYKKSNKILFSKIELCEKSKENGFYNLYMFSLFSNYLELDDKRSALRYFIKLKEYKTSELDTLNNSVNIMNYNYFTALSNFDFSNFYFRENKLDSAKYYLSKLKGSPILEDRGNRQEYYESYIAIYTKEKNYVQANLYKDSLTILQQDILSNQITNTIALNDDVVAFKAMFTEEEKSSKNHKILFYSSILLFLGFLFFVIYKREKIKELVATKSKRVLNLSQKVEHQEKISIQLKEKEKFLEEIKQELKNISRISNDTIRKQKVQELFRKIHSLTNTQKFTGSYEELKVLNSDFFINIKKKYPALNTSEQIICYYIFSNFKNTEIATLLNVSVRSVESKRYRISKKMAITNSKSLFLDKIKEIVN